MRLLPWLPWAWVPLGAEVWGVEGEAPPPRLTLFWGWGWGSWATGPAFLPHPARHPPPPPLHGPLSDLPDAGFWLWAFALAQRSLCWDHSSQQFSDLPQASGRGHLLGEALPDHP